MLTALRHPGSAGQQRRLAGHGQPRARPRALHPASQETPSASDGSSRHRSPPRRVAAWPPLSGGHGRPEVRPSGRSGAPRLHPQQPKAARRATSIACRPGRPAT